MARPPSIHVPLPELGHLTIQTEGGAHPARLGSGSSPPHASPQASVCFLLTDRTCSLLGAALRPHSPPDMKRICSPPSELPTDRTNCCGRRKAQHLHLETGQTPRYSLCSEAARRVWLSPGHHLERPLERHPPFSVLLSS